MSGEAVRFSQIIDLMWGKDVPTIKKTEGADKIVRHLMGKNYTPAAFASLSNDQKADAILTAMKVALMNLVRSGGQIDMATNLEQQIIDGGIAAVNSFDPDQP